MIWTHPDIEIKSSENADLATAIDAWNVMKQNAAFHEFARRWNNEDEREGLWKEIVEFWEVDNLFPEAPRGPPPQ